MPTLLLRRVRVALVCALMGHFAVGTGLGAQAPAPASMGVVHPGLGGALEPVPDAPRYTAQHFGERFGLGVVVVNGLAQDKQGFLWIATQTGVFRYDGSQVVQMTETDPLVGHYVDDLFTGPDSTIWIKGFLGIAHYTGDRFVPLRMPTAAIRVSRIPQGIAVDHMGDAYVALEDGLLVVAHDTAAQSVVLGTRDGFSGRTGAVALGPGDTIWATSGRRLGRLSPGSRHLVLDSLITLPAEDIYGVAFDGDGTMWLRSASHVARIDPANHRLTFDDAGVAAANPRVGRPTVDRAGNLMVPSVAGLFWRDHGHWRSITESQGLTGNAVQTAIEDREGVLWLGEFGTGLDRLAGIRDWAAWTTAEGLPSNTTWATARDRDHRLWIATARGLAVWDHLRHRWLKPRDPKGLADHEVTQLELAGDGSLWALSTMDGVVRIDPHTFAMRYSHSYGGKSYAYEALAPDGSVWATTLDKLVRFDPQSLTPRPVEIPLPEAMHGQIWYISFAPDGVLWATGRGTVAHYDGAHWRVLGKDDGVVGRSVTSVVAINAHDVWVGYNDLAHTTHFRMDSSGGVHADQYPWELATTARDREGRIWFNGRTGLTILARNGDLRTLGQADGLIWDDVGPDGVRQEADGSVYIATSRGVARLGPAAALTHPSAPGVALTSVQLGGRLQRDYVAEVPHDAGALSAFFTPLTLSNPDQVDCRYRLAGLEDQYTVTRQRQVQYRALPPGTYTLVVQCERESSGWTEYPARFTFTVRGPWWDQWWARLGLALVLWTGVWAVVQLRTRALVHRRQELEVAVAARSAELVEKNHELLEMSLTDPLTRTRNRRYLHETIQGEISHLMRVRGGPDRRAYAGELTFMMVDIDGFKQVNDVYGHAAGDRFLQAFSQRLAAIMRSSDVLIRWGGEEFLMICRGTDRVGGHAFSKRIIDEVAARPFELGTGLVLHRTCSVGWAPFPWVTTAADVLSVENVIELADLALYLAKNGGRHQSVGILPSGLATESPEQVRMDLLRTYPPDLVEIVRVLGNPHPVNRSA